MARRASSSVSPTWIIAGIVLLVAAITAGYFATNYVGDPYRTLEPLDVRVYLENSNSLRGNVYKIDGTIDIQLTWSATAGRLVSVIVPGPDGDQPLPVLVPSSFNHVNIQKDQHFVFKVEVGEQGILRVQDIEKA